MCERCKASVGGSLAAYDAAQRRRAGVDRLGGVDEAGRGALAGPVVAACVVLDGAAHLPEAVNDSKTLSAARREALVPTILEGASAWGLGWAPADEVDRLNVLAATLKAAARAIASLDAPPEFLVTDYLKLTDPPCPLLAIPNGDATSLVVAAASILAKVARDRLMADYDAQFPQYGFARHKGYGTQAHLAALEAHGPSTIHRLTFRGVGFFHTAPPDRPRDATPDWQRVLNTK